MPEKYPKLDIIAEKLSRHIANMITIEVLDVESKMPYKAQYVLEELIKKLQNKV
jgi:hypothetical protein